MPFALMTDSSDKATLNVTDFDPHSGIDRDFDGFDLKGEIILDAKGKKLGKVLASQYNVGVAMIDLNKLNANGPNHAYKLSGYRAIMWQPTWLDMQLSAEKEEDGEGEPEDES